MFLSLIAFLSQRHLFDSSLWGDQVPLGSRPTKSIKKKKKSFGSAARNCISSSFILFFVLLSFLLETKIKNASTRKQLFHCVLWLGPNWLSTGVLMFELWSAATTSSTTSCHNRNLERSSLSGTRDRPLTGWTVKLNLWPGIDRFRSMASTVAFQSAPEVIFHPIATVTKISLERSWNHQNVNGLFVTIQPNTSWWRAFEVGQRKEGDRHGDRYQLKTFG